MGAVKALLWRAVEYAGLFPPAALDMESALRNYQRYTETEEFWLLGGFLVAASRLEEFEEAFAGVWGTERERPWTLKVVCAGETAEDARKIGEFQEGAAFIGSLEAKAANARAAKDVLERLPAARSRYVEFPPDQAAEVLPVLGEYGARAKIRMGGTGAPVPSADTVARFLIGCAKERVAWKATAGLHHALRGEAREADKTEMQHGFVNLFLAGVLAYFGADEGTVVKTLLEEDAAAFQADDDVIQWRGNTLIADQIETVRSEFAIGFGSCSFEEPVEGLKGMGWL